MSRKTNARNNQSKTGKPSNGKGGKGRSNDRRTPDEKSNNRQDRLTERTLPPTNLPNNPKFYYGDVVLGDEISRFSFNQIGGLTKPPFVSGGGRDLPTIMQIPLNPCLGETDTYTSLELDKLYRLKVNGLNQALQQWWSVLTSKAGRGAQYSKVDLGILIGAIGEIISISEFLRRPFAYKFLYSERTRILPAQLIDAMGFDAADFLAHIADYRLQLNSILTRINQIPIPANIKYFAKCQDLYQKVYADAGSPLSQLYVMVPYTTWLIDETMSSTGSVLRTISGTAEVVRPANPNSEYYTRMYTNARTFGSWLNTLEQMVSALLSSSTWSTIYADLLNAATFNSVNLWKFDLVSEDYKLEVMYDPGFLLQIHNMMFLPPLDCDGDAMVNAIEAGTDYVSRYGWGTPLNDVYTDPDLDILVQNPTFGVVAPYYNPPIVVDMLTPTPTPEERIEANVYKFAYSSKTATIQPDNTTSLINVVLPDHYAMSPVVYSGAGSSKAVQPFPVDGNYTHELAFVPPVNAFSYFAFTWSKFQWAPVVFIAPLNGELVNPVGELNYYTQLDDGWIIRTTDAKYLGLFELS